MATIVTMTLGLAILGPLAAGPARAEVHEGRASITDGDSLKIHGVEIRLAGIDALEPDQDCVRAGGSRWPCGERATDALERETRGQVVSCVATGHDEYERVLAHCSVRDGDLGTWLVRRGLALAYRRYSERYVLDEDAARSARVGVWSGEFVAPWDWRHGGRRAAAQRDREAESANADCRIKGNISKSGRIYHVPGSRAYARTKINESGGERWFCTDEQARRAGWRAPKR